MQTIIKEQVNVRVKKEVSNILPRIEKLVNEQLESEILIDKIKSKKSIDISDEQKNLYKALIDAYAADKDLLDAYSDIVTIKRRRDKADDDQEPSAGTDRGSKRRRSGKEPASTSAPSETTTTTAGKTTTAGSKTHKQSASQSAPVEETMQTTDVGMKRIFKKRSKKKAKNKQIQARDGKDQVKSKSKVIRMKKIQLEGLKLPSLKLYYKRLKRQGPNLPTGQRLQLSYKTSGDQTAYFPKSLLSRPTNPGTTWWSSHTFSPAKPLLSLAKIISPTLLLPPSCIKSMLAIPLHSQSISMVEIVSKEAQKKSKAGICFRLTSHN
ncbi:hypothetical protein Tco_1000229 [Tanacetum coccineum]